MASNTLKADIIAMLGTVSKQEKELLNQVFEGRQLSNSAAVIRVLRGWAESRADGKSAARLALAKRIPSGLGKKPKRLEVTIKRPKGKLIRVERSSRYSVPEASPPKATGRVNVEKMRKKRR